MLKPKKKAKSVSRLARRRGDLVALREIVARHVAAAWQEGAEYIADCKPNATVRQYNNDFCGCLLPEFNMRRDWSKAMEKPRRK